LGFVPVPGLAVCLSLLLLLLLLLPVLLSLMLLLPLMLLSILLSLLLLPLLPPPLSLRTQVRDPVLLLLISMQEHVTRVQELVRLLPLAAKRALQLSLPEVLLLLLRPMFMVLKFLVSVFLLLLLLLLLLALLCF
jgi:hypothetical protein